LAIDAARALAILGMIIVNYRAMSAPDELGPQWLEFGVDRLEGKAAALFVVLAGVGLSLRARSWRRRRLVGRTLQLAIIRRSAVLFALGVLHLHVWEWDILHCYGLYLLVGASLMFASGVELLAAGAFIISVSLGFLGLGVIENPTDFWSARGAFFEMSIRGMFPLFPWAAFLVFGLWLGRRDLRLLFTKRSAVAVALLVVVGTELITDSLMPEHNFDERSLRPQMLAVAWPRPATPAFLASGMAVAFLVMAGLSAWERWKPDGTLLELMARTGRLSLTIYLAHAAAILVADAHGWFTGDDLPRVLGFGCVVYGVSMFAASWWTRRYDHGPIEAIVRQIADAPAETDRVAPSAL
jgi:uncharacterized membrane protein YeiB